MKLFMVAVLDFEGGKGIKYAVRAGDEESAISAVKALQPAGVEMEYTAFYIPDEVTSNPTLVCQFDLND